MNTKLDTLKQRLAEISDLEQAQAVLGWDMQTYMPRGGAVARSHQLGTLAKISHEKFTDAEVGKLLDELLPEAEQMDPDSDEARLIKNTKRQYDKEVRVPTRLVEEFAGLIAVAQEVWARARAENNYPAFQPYLERIFDLRREYAQIFAPYDHIYDPLLDDYEPGLKTADVQQIFQTLRQEQVGLISAIQRQQQIDNSFLRLPYNEQAQWDFGVSVINRFGFDWEHGRQDRSVHPFTTSFSSDDVRITTRFDPENGLSALFSTMHECGHGLYDQGVSPAYQRTSLAGAASLAIHESQSRMWENLVGRSLDFWSYFYPQLQRTFPDQLAKIDLDTFYRGINKVETSFIRVEADEATYNLHIMLRLELEIALLEGKLNAADLPEAWNSLSHQYLGITPPNNRLGVLQDVHWSSGIIGYFPTYALGNLVSVQLWEKVHEAVPDLDEQIRQGEFAALLGWLRANIHQYGSKFRPQELVQRITGTKIDPQPYLRYLKQKYGQIYSL